jgi:hypothetical protein
VFANSRDMSCEGLVYQNIDEERSGTVVIHQNVEDGDAKCNGAGSHQVSVTGKLAKGTAMIAGYM